MTLDYLVFTATPGYNNSTVKKYENNGPTMPSDGPDASLALLPPVPRPFAASHVFWCRNCRSSFLSGIWLSTRPAILSQPLQGLEGFGQTTLLWLETNMEGLGHQANLMRMDWETLKLEQIAGTFAKLRTSLAIKVATSSAVRPRHSAIKVPRLPEWLRLRPVTKSPGPIQKASKNGAQMQEKEGTAWNRETMRNVFHLPKPCLKNSLMGFEVFAWEVERERHYLWQFFFQASNSSLGQTSTRSSYNAIVMQNPYSTATESIGFQIGLCRARSPKVMAERNRRLPPNLFQFASLFNSIGKTLGKQKRSIHSMGLNTPMTASHATLFWSCSAVAWRSLKRLIPSVSWNWSSLILEICNQNDWRSQDTNFAALKQS